MATIVPTAGDSKDDSTDGVESKESGILNAMKGFQSAGPSKFSNALQVGGRRLSKKEIIRSLVSKKHQDAYRSVVEEKMRVTRGVTLENQDEDATTILADYLYYTTENLLASQPGSQLYALAFLFVFFLIVFSFLWWLVTQQIDGDDEADDDFNAAFGTADTSTKGWNSFYMTLQVLMTGGYDMGIGPTHNLLRFLFFLQILVGLVVFAILVGFITDIVQTFMDDLNKGKSKVTDRGHTLILGWNEASQRTVAQIAFLRRQIQMMNEEWIHSLVPIPKGFFSFTRIQPSTPVAGAKVVILANQLDKEEMQDLITATLLERGISPLRTKVN